MGTKYTSQSTSGYNASPPSDDGTAVSSNEVKWSFIKTKLADVLKTFGEGINTAILTHTDESILDKAVTYTTTAADHKRTVNITASATQSLGDAATLGEGYIVTIKNSHTAANTVDLATGTDTLDGTVGGSLSLGENESVKITVDSTQTGFETIGTGQSFASGTLMLFQQSTAPTGWTKETTHNDKALRVVSGAASSGGTNAFSTTFSATYATEDESAHTHTTSIPATGWSGGTHATARAYWAASDPNRVNTRNLTSGGGTAHAHDVDLDILYVDLIIASKD